jgi:hypothetical protein
MSKKIKEDKSDKGEVEQKPVLLPKVEKKFSKFQKREG